LRAHREVRRGVRAAPRRDARPARLPPHGPHSTARGPVPPRSLGPRPGALTRYRSHPQYRTVDRVDGVLLSHGHVDHVGSIGFLREDIPVYTGLTTALIGKCLQDPKPTGVDGEFNYLVPRAAKGDMLEVLRGAPRTPRRHL